MVGGDEEAPVHDHDDDHDGHGSTLSGIQPIQPFAVVTSSAAATAGDNDYEEAPEDGQGVEASSAGLESNNGQPPPTSSSEEFKRRRQELHKRLETLHQRQQIDF